MRVIILIAAFFLLGNVVLYLLPTDIETSNLRYASDPEINYEEIRFLLDEQAVTEVVNLPDSSSLPGQQGQEEQGQEDGSVATLSSVNQCFRIGPFLRETRVNAASKHLSDLSISYDLIKRQPTRVIASRVFVGPFTGASEAVAARKKLTESGISDHFHRRDADGAYIVSLGIYSKSASASALQLKFREKNIAAHIREENTQLPKNYWLELVSSTSEAQIASLDGIDWGESSVSAGLQQCQTSA